MSQNDLSIGDQVGASFLPDLNDVIAALASNSSGPTPPPNTFPLMWWGDTSSGYMMQRSIDDQTWLKKFRLEAALSESDDFNYFTNPQFEINQRGLTFNGGGYTSDMCASVVINDDITTTIVDFAIGDQIMPNQPAHAIRQTLNTATTASGSASVMQFREDVLQDFSNQDYTMSGWIVASRDMPIALELAQVFGVGGSTDLLGINVETINATTSWQYFEVSGLMPDITGKILGSNPFLAIDFWQSAGADFNVRTNSIGHGQNGQFLQLANLKLQKGLTATNCKKEHMADVLSRCQRYYENSWYPHTSRIAAAFSGYEYAKAEVTASHNPVMQIKYKTAKRTLPSTSIWSQSTDILGSVRDVATGNHSTVNVIANGHNGFYLTPNETVSSGSAIAAHWEADASL